MMEVGAKAEAIEECCFLNIPILLSLLSFFIDFY